MSPACQLMPLATMLMPMVVFSPSTISSLSAFIDCATFARVASNPSSISSWMPGAAPPAFWKRAQRFVSSITGSIFGEKPLL